MVWVSAQAAKKLTSFYQGGNLFTLFMPKMHVNCPNCGHHFEREPGFFFGDMYISYALTVFEAGMVILIASFFIGALFDTRVIWPVHYTTYFP